MFFLVPARGPTKMSDRFFGSVVTLLHFDGTNGSTTFTDQKGSTWTGGGSASLDTSIFKFGTASLNLVVGNISSNVAGLTFGTGDFTVEVQFYYTTNPSTYEMFLVSGSSNSYFGIKQQSGTAWKIVAAHDAGIEVLSASITVNTSTWYSFAISRSGDNLFMFQNGVLISTITGQTASNYQFNSGSAIIGTGAGQNATEHLDDFRATSVCRYTATYSPQSSPWPDQ